MTEQRETGARSATVVTVAIVLSRLVGLIRQRVAAHYFGTSAVADVIAAAFRIGNLAQNLLGEGTLSATFIPVYARLRAAGDEAGARAFARRALGALMLAVLGLTLAGVLGAPWLARVIAGGFEGEKLAFTIEQVRILFPMTGLLVISAWALGVLNSHRSFFLPYAAPILWSVAQIAALFVGGMLRFGDRAMGQALAVGALIGAAAVAVVLFARARRYTGSVRPSFDFSSPSLREAVGRFPSVLLGRGVIQISGLVDMLLVSFLGDSAVSTFNYAQTIYLLPMSILGTGEAAAALPEMAGDTTGTREERNRRIRERLRGSLTRVMLLAIPAVIVMALSGRELVVVLFRTGRFDDDSTARVASALSVYALALVGNAAVRLFATAFFALGDTQTPARTATARVLTSTAISLALMKPLGIAGVVAGATVAAWVEACLLGIALRRELDGLGLDALPLLKFAVLTLACGAAAIGGRLVLGNGSSTPLFALLGLATTGLTFVVTAHALGLVQLRTLRRS